VTRFFRQQLVPYSAAQMYAVVNDVEQYPKFLPLCRQTEILSQSPEQMVAKVVVGKGPLRVAWVTRNTLYPDTRIAMELVEGAFQQLEGEWIFTSVEDRVSHISLTLRYHLSPGIRAIAEKLLFGQMVDAQVKAFIDRAGELYD
jgi:ribosome-associated toxin RatA of RatAB toxin-antitoxin module